MNSNVTNTAFDKGVDNAYRPFYFENNIIIILFAKRFCCYLFAYKFCGQAKISVHGTKGCTDSQDLTPKNPQCQPFQTNKTESSQFDNDGVQILSL